MAALPACSGAAGCCAPSLRRVGRGSGAVTASGSRASAGAAPQPARLQRTAGGLLRLPAPAARVLRPRHRCAPGAATPEGAAPGGASGDDDKEKDLTGLLSRDNPDLVERFAVIGSGEAECKSCQYMYEPKMGDDNYPVAKGTRFENLPPDWRCPVCGAEKKMFESRSKVVAGFRQNQGYGIGGNTMTGEQKSLLIYGSLATFFALFLAGYLLD